MTGAADPHAGIEVLEAAPASGGSGALVALHGRGAPATEMRELGMVLAPGRRILAPQAAGRTWYPASFMAPIEENQPFLDSALAAVDRIVTGPAAGAGGGIALLGFSQGACLALEYAVRHPRRYDAVVALSGGLVGPPGTRLARDGALDSTPLLIACGDRDPHIPIERVHASAEAWEAMGGRVDLRVYPGMGHTVNADEMGAARALLGVGAAPGTETEEGR